MSASSSGAHVFEKYLCDRNNLIARSELLCHIFMECKELKYRLDKLMVDRGLVLSRERAQALIIAGRVLVNEQKIDKPGVLIAEDAKIRLLGDDLRYVSRGGLKLEHALSHWNIDVSGFTCLDIGASTGGFTDCLLQRGAARVIAVDTGYGQIDIKLRNDPRVTLLEKTNARYLKSGDLPPLDSAVRLAVMDVSFISATLVLPAVVESAHPEAIVVLVKPQFEVGRDKVGKGGIVRDEQAQLRAVEKVRSNLADLGYIVFDPIDSPILGAEGNREFLLYATRA
jgi:23S rRNA (cytidine1920-2'-O)/16S rRNA (cytidine1409-2'-O)-methyltransferase